jgi:hydroxymethylpyrimidine pyrophosphatase-like HAD family hydrolase
MNANPKRKFRPQKSIAVDVDGTLQILGKPNLRLIEWLKAKKDQGFSLMLWSSRGESNARHYAEAFGIADLFDVICSKPGYIVDDKGWKWTQYTRVISHVLPDAGENSTENQKDIEP